MYGLNVNSTVPFKVNGFCSQCMSFFKTSNPNIVLLFNGWKVSSISVLVGSCIGVFFLSVLSEFLRYKRSSLVRKVPHKPSPPLPSDNTNAPSSNEDPEESQDVTADQSPDELSGSTVTLSRETSASQSKGQDSPFSTHHILQVIFHITQLVLGYVMMLVVMTFNVWLGAAVVLGLGTGYFICHNDYIVSVDSNSTSTIQLKIVE